MKIFVLICFSIGYLKGYAQKDCPFYDKYIHIGDSIIDKGEKADFQAAINAFSTAMLHCPEKAQQARNKILDVFKAIEDLKNKAQISEQKALRAIQQSRMAEIARDQSLMAMQESLRQKMMAENERQRALNDLKAQKGKTDSALVQANKLIDAYYFYADRFALAFKNDLFYFIDKNGDRVTKLGEWFKAEQFELNGLAKVKRGFKSFDMDYYATDYLIDTSGNKYKVAFDTEVIDSNVRAFDLSYKDLRENFDGIFANKALQILILSGIRLERLPKEIGELKNLEFLDLENNALSSLPVEISNLKNLKLINLSGNYFHPKQIENIRELLPNCQVISNMQQR